MQNWWWWYVSQTLAFQCTGVYRARTEGQHLCEMPDASTGALEGRRWMAGVCSGCVVVQDILQCCLQLL